MSTKQAINASPENKQSVQSLINNEQVQLSQLKQSLLREQSALAARDSEALKQCIELKQISLQGLAQNTLARRQLLQQSGLKDSSAQWYLLLDQLDQQNRSQLREHWRTLENALRECQSINESNAKIIARSQFSVGHVLDLLRGKFEQPKLYTQYGKTGASIGQGRTITTA